MWRSIALPIPPVQARSVALFRALGDPEQMKYAEAHKAIIDRLGRFHIATRSSGEPLRQPRKRFSRSPEALSELPWWTLAVVPRP
jgi:uncharacterized protein (DUF924 family)